jgi:hypothetical protein
MNAGKPIVLSLKKETIKIKENNNYNVRKDNLLSLHPHISHNTTAISSYTCCSVLLHSCLQENAIFSISDILFFLSSISFCNRCIVRLHLLRLIFSLSIQIFNMRSLGIAISTTLTDSTIFIPFFFISCWYNFQRREAIIK